MEINRPIPNNIEFIRQKYFGSKANTKVLVEPTFKFVEIHFLEKGFDEVVKTPVLRHFANVEIVVSCANNCCLNAKVRPNNRACLKAAALYAAHRVCYFPLTNRKKDVPEHNGFLARSVLYCYIVLLHNRCSLPSAPNLGVG